MAYLFCSFLPGLIETQVTPLLVRNQRLALETKSLSQTFFKANSHYTFSVEDKQLGGWLTITWILEAVSDSC